MQILSVIDTFGYFFRNFYALPKLRSKDGFPTGVLVGFVNLVNQLYKDNTSHLVFALEGEGDKFRKQISPLYKANRQEADPDLIVQIKVAIDWIKKMRLSNISIDGYEADDVIASISHSVRDSDVLVRIVSVDKDLYQLINKNTYIYDPMKKMDIDAKECFDKFGVYPDEFVDYQSLVGDSSDNISGISGIGPKSARVLINNFKSLEGIYENIDRLRDFLSPRLVSKIIDGKNDAYLSKKLVELKKDLLISFDLDSAIKPESNPLFLIKDELEKYNINILSKALKVDSNNKISDFKYKCIFDYDELVKIISSFDESSVIAFDTETDSLDSINANIVGFSFASSLDCAYYVPIAHNYLGVPKQISMKECKSALEKLFTFHIVGHNLKFDMQIIKNNFNLSIENYSDTMILAWLKDTSQKYGLDYLVKNYFDYETIKFEDIVKGEENFSNISIDIATKYATQDAICTLALYYEFTKTMPESLAKLAKELEFPFIKTLMHMESKGISIDNAFFISLRDELQNKIFTLSKKIFSLCESEFNINSTKQLSYILFDKLGLKKGRLLKSASYSTDEKTLESLLDKHPIIALLLEYRELSKLLNTYVLPILNLSRDNRIYTSFLQTGTSTGRLSSKSPNLQNIPVKTEMGRRIRKGFIAKNGYKLISADYSQIELRLLAHFSKDSSLIESFQNDKDIHLETATKLFGESLAKERRHIAKSINFGLIYGMGVNKLAQTLKITQSESKKYIDNYFNNFPTVKEYLSSQEEEIIKNGYSQTILGRRRVFKFYNVQSYEKLAFLREGINAIFQGSAADLIKLSMNECYKRFESRDINLLLQVHDELIFEVKEEILQEASIEILNIMNNAYKLNVPLKCTLNIGENWFSLK